MLPRALVAGGARARKRQVFEVQRAEVALEIRRFLTCPAGRASGARLERFGEATHRGAPPLSVCLAIETLDELRVDRQPSHSTPGPH